MDPKKRLRGAAVIEEMRRRANTYLFPFRLARREALEVLDEIDALRTENDQLMRQAEANIATLERLQTEVSRSRGHAGWQGGIR